MLSESCQNLVGILSASCRWAVSQLVGMLSVLSVVRNFILILVWLSWDLTITQLAIDIIQTIKQNWMKYWYSVWTICNTFLVRDSIEKPQIQFYKCNNHKSLNAPSSLLLAPSEAWTIKFNIMAPTKIGCLSAVLLEGDYVREGSMGRLLSSYGSKVLLGFLKIMCTTQVLIHLYNYFSERTLLEHAIDFEQNSKSTPKIFQFFIKTVVVQIVLYKYSTIVNNSKKVIKMVQFWIELNSSLINMNEDEKGWDISWNSFFYSTNSLWGNWSTCNFYESK